MMTFNNPYWTPETKIDTLARWIIIHSIIYYELNESIVSDQLFDSNSRLFVHLVDVNKEAFKRSYYYEIMKDFDGNTGFDLFHRLKQTNKLEANRLYGYAIHILKQGLSGR